MSPDEALQLAIDCATEIAEDAEAHGRYGEAEINRELATGLITLQTQVAGLRMLVPCKRLHCSN